jgi:signal transduction histidine kinase
MRLGEFILRDMEPILQRWEAFATTRVPAAEHMSSRSLRDHGPEILQAIVADLASPQTPAEQSAKSMGLAPVATNAPHTAAQTHAVLRAESGFDIEQLASEYRALRASVLSGWMEACLPTPPHFTDMLRFNEAIDQALAESIAFFAAHVTRARNLLLGMLSHDMRSPLQTIQLTARALQRMHASAQVDHAAELLIRSGGRMQKLLDDQIDFNRTELGLGIGVKPRNVDLGAVCAEELEQIRAAYAERALEMEVTGDCHGAWDAGRIQQLLNNLVVNAVHYGEPQDPIHVALRGSASDVCLTVANAGETIDDETLAHIFEPMRRGTDRAARHDSGLGLGLYIASEIAKAHGGAIAVDSKGRRTVFKVSLPKVAAAAY